MSNCVNIPIVQTTCYLTALILCHNLSATYLFIFFESAHTTRNNPIRYLNLNYKKLLKCVDITNFKHMNFNYKKS